MITLIKYELKKIFQSKLCLVVLALCIIGVFASSLYSANQYKEGILGFDPLIFKEDILADQVVSNKTIDTLRTKLEEYEARDDIYEPFQSPSGGRMYRGKYSVDKRMTIKKEYLAEYLALYYPVWEYDNMKSSLESDQSDAAKDNVSSWEKLFNAQYDKADEAYLENGFVYGYNFAWENIAHLFSESNPLLLAFVTILGLCNVFTGEYSFSTDALLLSSKRGKRQLVSAKILASLIYIIICTMIYIFSVIVINFTLLGAKGADTTMLHQFYFGQPVTYLEGTIWASLIILGAAILLGGITLAASAAFSKPIPAVAVSVLLCILPAFLSDFIHVSDTSLFNFIEILPINILQGPHLSRMWYLFFRGQIFDLKLFFAPMAIVVILICLPIIHFLYCNHQVKN